MKNPKSTFLPTLKIRQITKKHFIVAIFAQSQALKYSPFLFTLSWFYVSQYFSQISYAKIVVRSRFLDQRIRYSCLAAITGAPNGDEATARLLRNQEDIGNAIIPFYGQPVGAKLTELLKQHIMGAVDLVAAAKAGDQKKFAEADKKWTQNADEIAAFLSGANPNWPKKDVTDLLYLHLKLTKEEATAILTKKWNEAVKKFDEIYTEIFVLADALTEGIIKQFPNKF
jgi:hypothetical protein